MNLNDYYERRDQLEKSWQETALRLEAQEAGDSVKMQFMQEAWQQEATLIQEFINENRHRPVRPRGNPYYRSYWRRQNQRLLPAEV